MRKWTIGAAIALAAMVTGGGFEMPQAVAQDYLGSYLQTQRDNNIRMHQQQSIRQAQRRQAERRQAERRDPQRHVRSSNAHVRRCAARYRSYDARTDTFIARPGVRRKCRL